ncbi:GGDEF domain-containing protein [Actinocorallia longicatena]|uniref:GGDEF domain-containing protein n=1 Tax=Actinocorallia longicatena TaxID=111803 RepID=A0ABP6QGV8_9ACTN
MHQSAADEHRREGEPGRGPARWPLLAQPLPLVGYVFLVVTGYVGITVWAAAHTAWRWEDALTFVALGLCGAVCIEASRRLGMPAGVARDLLSAWWLPVALLLPPVYALLVPLPLQMLLQYRVRATMPHRRVFAAAALGLSGAAASLVFHQAVPHPLAGPGRWVTDDQRSILVAIGCAVLFIVLNTMLVAVAAHAATQEGRWRDVLWTRESLLLDVVELCVGVIVAITCVISPALLLLALPPVVLLQRSLMHQQLQAAARTDAKTGLLNAGAWQREADTELSRAQRSHEPLAVLLVDIDHFKRVNDTYGHLIGDQVLISVSSTLVHQLRDYDVIGRFGGEEFAVLLPGADTVEACRVAERLRARVRRLAVPAEESTVSVTISVGVALFRTHGQDLIELLASADLALYRAKESGRDRVCLPAVRKAG